MPSTIEWTDETWNPTVGCSRVSPGCDHCYAIGVAHRGLTEAHRGLTIRRPGERPDWTGEVRYLPERLDVPLRWRKPRRVFVDSMSDLFHPDVPGEFVADVFASMALARQHTFQILTKRPQRMADIVPTIGAVLHEKIDGRVSWDQHPLRYPTWPLPNVWLGTSIESDRYAWRAHHLRDTPAALRFLSLEPLLGPLPSLRLDGIGWVIVGGESGPGARPMHPAWVRDIRNRCVDAGVPFFFKQWGSWGPDAPLDGDGHFDFAKGWTLANDGTLYEPDALTYPDGPRYAEALHAGHGRAHLVGMYHRDKHATGRELDGRTWDEMPAAAA